MSSGTTPGPTIVADEGDQLSINVVNKGDEPITIQYVILCLYLPSVLIYNSTVGMGVSTPV
jgi:FtsP/CotA-like multicopper oxidase with cupredoxin domain